MDRLTDDKQEIPVSLHKQETQKLEMPKGRLYSQLLPPNICFWDKDLAKDKPQEWAKDHTNWKLA